MSGDDNHLELSFACFDARLIINSKHAEIFRFLATTPFPRDSTDGTLKSILISDWERNLKHLRLCVQVE